MTDLEIIEWLRGLEPENIIQKEKIEKAIDIFLTEIHLTSADIYLNKLAYDDVYMKNPTYVYEDYKRYCEENNLKSETINMFSRTVKKIFHLKAKPVNNNYGETIRLYVENE